MGLTMPSEIPKSLRDSAFAVGVPQDVPAWQAKDALDVVDALSGTKIAILEVGIHRPAPGGLIETGDGWTCERFGTETATEFAERSRRTASTFIRTRSLDARYDEELYALVFSGQQEAA